MSDEPPVRPRSPLVIAEFTADQFSSGASRPFTLTVMTASRRLFLSATNHSRHKWRFDSRNVFGGSVVFLLSPVIHPRVWAGSDLSIFRAHFRIDTNPHQKGDSGSRKTPGNHSLRQLDGSTDSSPLTLFA